MYFIAQQRVVSVLYVRVQELMMKVVETANVIEVTNQPGYLEKLEALQQRYTRVCVTQSFKTTATTKKLETSLEIKYNCTDTSCRNWEKKPRDSKCTQRYYFVLFQFSMQM